MPSENAHLQLQAWVQQYGPIYSLILGTKVMVVLNSPEVVKGRIQLVAAIQTLTLTRHQSSSTVVLRCIGAQSTLYLVDRLLTALSDRIDAYVGSTLVSKDMKILTMR